MGKLFKNHIEYMQLKEKQGYEEYTNRNYAQRILDEVSAELDWIRKNQTLILFEASKKLNDEN